MKLAGVPFSFTLAGTLTPLAPRSTVAPLFGIWLNVTPHVEELPQSIAPVGISEKLTVTGFTRKEVLPETEDPPN